MLNNLGFRGQLQQYCFPKQSSPLAVFTIASRLAWIFVHQMVLKDLSRAGIPWCRNLHFCKYSFFEFELKTIGCLGVGPSTTYGVQDFVHEQHHDVYKGKDFITDDYFILVR